MRSVDVDECPRCGYLGWADSASLDEHLRKLIRERSPGIRRLNAA